MNFRKIVELKPRKIYSLPVSLHNQVNDVTISCISYYLRMMCFNASIMTLYDMFRRCFVWYSFIRRKINLEKKNKLRKNRKLKTRKITKMTNS